MNISIQSSLCRGLRACGLTKSDTHLILNDIEKWYSANGPEWTNDRIKAYKAWYESYLSGTIVAPDWFRKSKKYLPLGIWGKIFRMKNPSRVFAVLSANTVFINRKISKAQRDKFLGALSAPPFETSGIDVVQIKKKEDFLRPVPQLQITTPSFDSITGKSIPISPDEGKRFIQSEDDVILAYAESWQNVPLPTLRYLRSIRELQQVPPSLLNENGKDGLFAILPEQENIVGFIGCIQQPGLKARWVANVNRITQHYLRPLGDDWYDMARHVKSDCTFDQESGVRWVQEQLKAGEVLSGADLSSATDLLDRKMCVDIILHYFYGKTYSELLNSDKDLEREYAKAVTHFLDISAGEWVYPEGGTVRWNRGQPLGSHPSFALLTLTNNLVARQAEKDTYGKGVGFTHFRVIGDDIIMTNAMLDRYCELIERLGGSINHSKTLTSARVAEFAGRIITPDRSFNKTVKFQDMSDNSFLSIMSNLGEQAKSLLKPRQRKVYEQVKFVPGVIVDGPYSQQSHGQPLEFRYDWYLNYSGLTNEKLAPDKEVLDSYRFCNKIFYKLQSEGRLDEFEYSVPFVLADDFQSSLATAAIECKSGDPRLRDFGGMTALEVLERTCNSETFESYSTYISYKRDNLLKALAEIEAKIDSYESAKDLQAQLVAKGVSEPDTLTKLVAYKGQLLMSVVRLEKSKARLSRQPIDDKKLSLEEVLHRAKLSAERENAQRSSTKQLQPKKKDLDR